MIGSLVDQILSAPTWLVLLVVGLLVFAEDAIFVGFVLPGETAAILGGVAASLGHVPLPAVIAVVIIAAIVGDTVGYEIGRAVGPKVLNARAFAKHRSRIEEAERFLAGRGGWAVFLARWVAFLRAVMPALAGVARMRYLTFLTFNAAGGILWGAASVTLGYVAGASYARVEKTLGRDAAIAVAAIVVVAVVVWEVRRRRRAAREESREPERESPDPR